MTTITLPKTAQEWPPIDTDTAESEPAARFENDGLFHVRDDASANWLLRKLANIEAEKTRVQAQAAAIVAQLEDDRARLLHLFEGELLDYCRLKLAQNGSRRRFLTFLQGTVAFRQVPASVRVADPFRALDHCQTAAPGLVRTAVTVDAAGYRDLAARHWKETGEILPGTETTPAHETHSLKFGK